jgi:hypothetical protein
VVELPVLRSAARKHGKIALDDRRVVVGEDQRGGHHGTCGACASIPSAARRYFPAS